MTDIVISRQFLSWHRWRRSVEHCQWWMMNCTWHQRQKLHRQFEASTNYIWRCQQNTVSDSCKWFQVQQCDISDMTEPDRSAEVIVAAWYGDAEIYHLLFFLCVCVLSVTLSTNFGSRYIVHRLSDRDEIWHIDRGCLAVHQRQDWWTAAQRCPSGMPKYWRM